MATLAYPAPRAQLLAWNQTPEEGLQLPTATLDSALDSTIGRRYSRDAITKGMGEGFRLGRADPSIAWHCWGTMGEGFRSRLC